MIAKALGELNEHAVFVGGATLPFYLPEVYSSQARPTEDIDIVMEVIGRNKNWLNEKSLRLKGFKHDFLLAKIQVLRFTRAKSILKQHIAIVE